MRDQVIALEHKADRMVAVGVPVPVIIFPCRDSVYDQISVVIAIKTADNIQQCCLSGTGNTESIRLPTFD